jgi:hypothetical protein
MAKHKQLGPVSKEHKAAYQAMLGQIGFADAAMGMLERFKTGNYDNLTPTECWTLEHDERLHDVVQKNLDIMVLENQVTELTERIEALERWIVVLDERPNLTKRVAKLEKTVGGHDSAIDDLIATAEVTA